MAMTAMSVRANLCELSEIFAVGLADTVGLLSEIYYGEKKCRGRACTWKKKFIPAARSSAVPSASFCCCFPDRFRFSIRRRAVRLLILSGLR